jgi:hypothetical protein
MNKVDLRVVVELMQKLRIVCCGRRFVVWVSLA